MAACRRAEEVRTGTSGNGRPENCGNSDGCKLGHAPAGPEDGGDRGSRPMKRGWRPAGDVRPGRRLPHEDRATGRSADGDLDPPRRWLMHRSVAAFIDHLRTERQASSHTVRSYEDDLELYSSYLAEVQGEDADPVGGGPGPVATVFGLAGGPGIRAEHDRAAAGEPAFVLPVPAPRGPGDGGPGGRSSQPEAAQAVAAVTPG